MAEKTTYIRLDRNILKWRWWSDHNTLIVFLYILLSANITEHGFSGITVHRGQLATSIPSLCNSTGLTKMQIRTALQHLKTTGEITAKVYPKFQVITVVNYDVYQNLTGKTAYKQQADNSHVTGKQHQSKKGEKGEKERRNGRSAPGSPSGRSVDDIGREEGTYEDIPIKHRDGTYHNFTLFTEYYDWRNQ